MRALSGGQRIGVLWDLGGDVFRFPAWWYGRGLVNAAQYAVTFVTGYSRKLGLFVWAKNIFTPMFGRYDWQSRIISVFMRVMNVIIRGLLVCFVALFALFGFCVYVGLPLAALVFVLFHATALFAL